MRDEREQGAAPQQDTPDTHVSGVPAPALPEPTDPRAASELAALMFKSPLDTTKRVPAAPDPGAATPRGGARPELPIVYGPRQVAQQPAGVVARAAAPVHAGIPDGPSAADRAALPSLAKQNRRFRQIALLGGPAILLCVVGALWGLTQLAMSWI